MKFIKSDWGKYLNLHGAHCIRSEKKLLPAAHHSDGAGDTKLCLSVKCPSVALTSLPEFRDMFHIPTNTYFYQLDNTNQNDP